MMPSKGHGTDHSTYEAANPHVVSLHCWPLQNEAQRKYAQWISRQLPKLAQYYKYSFK